jgi:hypothetical protein
VIKKWGSFPYSENQNSPLQPGAAHENARLFRSRFMAEWELVADDENTPNTDAARSQLAPRVAKNCTDFRKMCRASPGLGTSNTRNYGYDSATQEPRITRITRIWHSSFGILKISPQFPPNNFPERPLLRSLDSTTTNTS